MTIHPTFTEADHTAIRGIHGRATVRTIIADVAQVSGIAPSSITGPCRAVEFVRARDVVCYIASREGMSYSQIGRVLNRDHTTVMAAVRRERARRGEVSA